MSKPVSLTRKDWREIWAAFEEWADALGTCYYPWSAQQSKIMRLVNAKLKLKEKERAAK